MQSVLDDLLKGVKTPSATGTGKKKKLRVAVKREQLRDSLWPGAGELIWSRHKNDGYTTLPRVVPLVMLLIKNLSRKGDPSGVYLDFWMRAYDEGIVTVSDETALAYSAGYCGRRAVRTWREHVQELVELGFVRVKPEGNREIGHVLILNPLGVCAGWFNREPRKVGEEWWSAFLRRASEVGAVIPGMHQEG